MGNCLIIRFWEDNWILNVGHLRNHCVQPLINVDSYVRFKGNTLMPSVWNFSLLTSKLPPHICDITKTIPASGDDNFHDVLAWLGTKNGSFFAHFCLRLPSVLAWSDPNQCLSYLQQGSKCLFFMLFVIVLSLFLYSINYM